jgi:hypothetical protein
MPALTVNTNENERFWAIQMITTINRIADHKTWEIKSAGGELTIKTGINVRFPDVILYRDKTQTAILQGWEIKMPDVDITNSEFIADAQRKANFMGSNSCLLWNFRYCVLYVKGADGVFHIEKTWDDTSFIAGRADVRTYRKEWESLLERVLLELNSFLATGILSSVNLDFAVSERIMPDLIAGNKVLTADYMKAEASVNAVFKSTLEVWWSEVRQEYLQEEPDMYYAYSRMVILHWINRILFANLIRLYHNPANEIKNLTYDTSPKEAEGIFEKISAACDFYNIFKSTDYSTLIPAATWNDFIELNRFLSRNEISAVNQTALQAVLENAVVTSKRVIIGQYTTPPKLAELLVKITLLDSSGTSIDPCCGTGTIPKEMIRYKLECGQDTVKAYETTWAADKFSFPLQVTNISLTNPESMNIPCRIIKKNLFSLKSGSSEHIVNPADGCDMLVTVPQFDAILSNLPFVDFNTLQREDKEYMSAVNEAIRVSTGMSLSERNDVYAYMVIDLWSKLKTGGRIGVITSNSWLGTSAGKDFFTALRWFYDVEGIYMSGNGRWFDNAKVASLILILVKKETPSMTEGTITFGLIKKKLSDWEDNDIFAVIKNSIILKRELNPEIIGLQQFSFRQIETILKLGLSMNVLFYRASWISVVSEKLCPLNLFLDPIRGEKTGQDAIFYLKDKTVVDPEFIIRGLKNSKKISGLVVSPDTDVFYCNKTRDELILDKKEQTLRWLERFDSILNQSVRVKGRDWHIMRNVKPVQLFFPMNPFDRLFYGKFETPTFINQRLIGFLGKSEDLDMDLLHALLNSIVNIFLIEAMGVGMGLGALDTRKNDFETIYMLNPDLLDEEDVKRIKQAFEPLCRRKIMNTLTELEMEDRIAFEHTVLCCYGLENYYDDMKNSLISIQKARLSVSQQPKTELESLKNK